MSRTYTIAVVGATGAVGGLERPAILGILIDLVGGLEEPRFDGDDQARTQLVAVVGLAVVGHMRIAVHDMADAMAAELQVDRVSVGTGHVAHGAGHVTQAVAGLGGGDGGGERLLGALDQTQVLRVLLLADHEADGGVRHPAVDTDRQVKAQQIAVLQRVVIGHAMQHGVVDGGADVVGERTGAEVGGVIHVAGFGALAAFDAATYEVVDLQQVGADLGGFLQVGQDAGHETAGGLHRFDFRWCLQFDHA